MLRRQYKNNVWSVRATKLGRRREWLGTFPVLVGQRTLRLIITAKRAFSQRRTWLLLLFECGFGVGSADGKAGGNTSSSAPGKRELLCTARTVTQRTKKPQLSRLSNRGGDRPPLWPLASEGDDGNMNAIGLHHRAATISYNSRNLLQTLSCAASLFPDEDWCKTFQRTLNLKY